MRNNVNRFALIAAELEFDYQGRNFTKDTLAKAECSALAGFKELQNLRIEEFSADQWKNLSSTVEVLDYFNKFDEALGVTSGTESRERGEIYNWFLSLGKQLMSSMSLTVSPGDLMLIAVYFERIRFTAASVLNEIYRHNDQRCVEALELDISAMKDLAKLFTETEKASEEYIRYLDNLSYIYFLYGKACRQFRLYISAEESFELSTICLMKLLKHFNEIAEDNSQQDHIQSKIMRIGVVHLAQSAMYLSWGKINKAERHIQAALNFLGKHDLASIQDAKAINGVIIRIKAGTNKKLLRQSIKLLEESYHFFISEQIMPRRAIRNLVALETALIIVGNLEKAVRKLTSLFKNRLNEVKHDEFDKLLKKPHWIAQLHTIFSRIAQKDKNDTYLGDLLILAEKLDNCYLIKKTHLGKTCDSESKGETEVSSLKFAVSEARKAIHIAPPNTRIEFDAWWALGEAQIKLKKYDLAEISYRKVLDLCLLTTDKKEMTPNIITPLVAGCYLNLAKISIRQRQFDDAGEWLTKFDNLGVIEHQWINEMAREVQNEYKNYSSKQFVIEFKDSWTMDDFEAELQKQIALKFDLKTMTLKDFETKFKRKKNVYYKLKKIESDQGNRRS